MDKVKKDAFFLIGLKLLDKTTNEGGQSSIDCGHLWKEFETNNFAKRIPSKVNDEIYAVYFDYEGDYTKPFSYFIGCMVKPNSDVPPGMHSLYLPAENYIKVLAKGKMPDCIVNSWMEIWRLNINRSYRFDFEVYNERSINWNNAEVEIFVSSN